jgi:hypothetical protein
MWNPWTSHHITCCCCYLAVPCRHGICMQLEACHACVACVALLASHCLRGARPSPGPVYPNILEVVPASIGPISPHAGGNIEAMAIFKACAGSGIATVIVEVAWRCGERHIVAVGMFVELPPCICDSSAAEPHVMTFEAAQSKRKV